MPDGAAMDILTELKSLSTTALSDATGGLRNMDPAIRPLRDGWKICGPAFTANTGINDNIAVYQAIRLARPGDVLVIAAKGAAYNPIAGDFVIGMAHVMGISGVVTDGTVRDVHTIRSGKLPVFCQGATIAMPQKGRLGEVGGRIACGGVPVFPGDWIVGDDNGVTVIPQAEIARAIAGAKAKEAKDDERAKRVLVSREAVRAYLDEMLLDNPVTLRQ